MVKKMKNQNLVLPGREGLTFTGQYGIKKKEAIIRQAVGRIAIYRKLKELGHTDEKIVTVYKKSLRDN